MRLIGYVLMLTLVVMVQPARAVNMLMGIAEGVAEQAGFGEMQDKYQPLADYLGRALNTKITLESSQNIQSAILNVKKERYDLMFCRPSNITGRAIRDNKYHLVAMAKGDFTANFIVAKDSPFKTPKDIIGHKIAMPEKNALMSRVAVATLRDLGGNPDEKNIRYTRYQEAVNFMVEKKFVEVGVVAPVLAKAWEKQGGVILFKSKKLPFWSIIASPKMSKDQVAKLQKALIEMENTEEGKKILAKITVKGWLPGNAQDYLDMMTWLGV